MATESKWRDECYHVVHACKCHFFFNFQPFLFIISTASLIVSQSGELCFVFDNGCFFDMIILLCFYWFFQKKFIKFLSGIYFRVRYLLCCEVWIILKRRLLSASGPRVRPNV